jgi:hypothetical protein
MAVYAVTEVRLDDKGRVIQAKMGAVFRKGVEWVAAPDIVDVMQVVSAIRAGDDVFTMFLINGKFSPGPKLSVMIDSGSGEGVGIEGSETPGMRLHDLPTF